MAGHSRTIEEESHVGENMLWKCKLRKLLDQTETPATLEEALLPMLPLLAPSGVDEDDLRAIAADCVDKMSRRLPSLEDGHLIEPQKAATLHAYTLEQPSIYGVCSKSFSAPDRFQAGKTSFSVQQCLPFYKLLDESAEHLPLSYRYTGEVYRGVKWCFPTLDLHSPEAFREFFSIDRKLTWFEPKSTSRDHALMYEEQFCGTKGARTIFNVQVCHGYNIERFSAFGPQEQEVLLPILSDFVVVARTVNMTISKPHAADKASIHHKGHPDMVVLRQLLPESSSKAEGKLRKDKHEPEAGVTVDMVLEMALAASDGAALERLLGEAHTQTVAAWARWSHECARAAVALGTNLPDAPSHETGFEDLVETVCSAAWGAANERKFGSAKADAQKAWARFSSRIERLAEIAKLSSNATKDLKWFIFNACWRGVNGRWYGPESNDSKEAAARAEHHFEKLGGHGALLLRRR